jgi:hypothetical protein
MSIPEPAYWKREAEFYREELSDTIWKQLITAYRDDVTTEAEKWRNIAFAYKKRLHRQGRTLDDVRQRRLLIEDQAYWKPEAEHLRKASDLAEVTVIRKRLKQKPHQSKRANVRNTAQKAPSERRCNQHQVGRPAAVGNETNRRCLRDRSGRVRISANRIAKA